MSETQGGGLGSQGEHHPKPGGGSNRKGGIGRSMPWVYVVLGLGIIAVNFLFGRSTKQETNWHEVRNGMLAKGYVSKLVGVRNKGIVEVYLTQEGLEHYSERLGGRTDGFTAKTPAFYFTIGSVESFEKQLEQAQANLPEEKRIYPSYEDRVDYLG